MTPPKGIMLTIDGGRQAISPAEILCAQAMNKGLTYTLADGRQAFEYHVLQDLPARCPELIQVNRNALVRAGAITALVYDGDERFVELEGGRRIQASRRRWVAVRERAKRNPGVQTIRARGIRGGCP